MEFELTSRILGAEIKINQTFIVVGVFFRPVAHDCQWHGSWSTNGKS